MLKILGVLLLVAVIFLLFNLDKVKRLQKVMTLFDQEYILDNFLHMEDKLDVAKIAKSPSPTRLSKKLGHQLPETFNYNGKPYNVKEYMEYSQTTGMTIIHKDTIIYESYFNGMEESTTHISWSMAKSFVSAMLGIALNDGLIESLDDPITKYLPQLKDCGYNEVPIRAILQMSSGVGFNEDYRDFNSDINRFGRYMALGTSFEKFAMTLKNERPPGTYNHYVSIDTQVLGMLLKKVTQKPLSIYLKEKIWDPMGMEYDAQWLVDDTGMEMALGGLNVTLRDYAKFGLLYLHEGNWFGNQIVPQDWVRQSINTDAPHLRPGDNPKSSNRFGYGFQWWTPEVQEGDYFAAGIYNQYIYIFPAKDLVVVKTSANYHFKEPDDESKDIHVALLKEISRQFENKEEPQTAMMDEEMEEQ